MPNLRYYNEDEFYFNTQSLVVSPDAPFDWKLLLIGIVSAKGIWKKVPILQVGGPAPARPTLPVIRVVLLHTEAMDKDLCPHTVNLTFNGAVVVSIVVTNRAFKYACVLIIKNQRLKAVQDKIPMIHNNV